MEHILRQYKKIDAQSVKNLILGVLSKEYPFDMSAYSDSDINNISETYGGKRDAFFVIEQKGDIVGTVGVKHDTESCALLRRLFVDVKYRRHGYGAELADKAIDFCKNNGYKKIYFRCTDRMIKAMALCKKKGFREVEMLSLGGFNIHKLELDL